MIVIQYSNHVNYNEDLLNCIYCGIKVKLYKKGRQVEKLKQEIEQLDFEITHPFSEF